MYPLERFQLYHFGHDRFRFGNVILNSSFSLSLHCYGKLSKTMKKVKYLLFKNTSEIKLRVNGYHRNHRTDINRKT